MSPHQQRIDRKGRAIRELAEKIGYSRATIARAASLPRAEWLQQKADEHEAIRRYHDDQGHSWPETAEHFKLSYQTVKDRAYRARKEQAAEAVAAALKAHEQFEPPLIAYEEVKSA
jgi:transposase